MWGIGQFCAIAGAVYRILNEMTSLKCKKMLKIKPLYHICYVGIKYLFSFLFFVIR